MLDPMRGSPSVLWYALIYALQQARFEDRIRPPNSAANALARCRQRDYNPGPNRSQVVGFPIRHQRHTARGSQEYTDAASDCKALGLNFKERSSGKHKERRVTTGRNGVFPALTSDPPSGRPRT
jgi:hypothetical protein